MNPPPNPLSAVIFDLDGVLVSTDELHFLGWSRLAAEEGIPFDRADNLRLRGVSRQESLEILLERASRTYRPDEKLALADRKNGYYQELLRQLSPGDVLPGALDLVRGLHRLGLLVAVGSSSRNAPAILQRTGLVLWFDVVVDGNDLRRSKPDPEVFLLAARRLDAEPARCLVVEDAPAGVLAARAAGMFCLAVGLAAGHPQAHFSAPDLARLRAEDLLGLVGGRAAAIPGLASPVGSRQPACTGTGALSW